ncbi:MAG: hypothetical protein ACLUFN_04370 [Eubacterium sp.]
MKRKKSALIFCVIFLLVFIIIGVILYNKSFVNINLTFNPRIAEQINITYNDSEYNITKDNPYYGEIVSAFSGCRIKIDDVSHEIYNSFKFEFVYKDSRKNIYSSNLSYDNLYYYQYGKIGGYPDNMFEFYIELSEDEQNKIIEICENIEEQQENY